MSLGHYYLFSLVSDSLMDAGRKVPGRDETSHAAGPIVRIVFV